MSDVTSFRLSFDRALVTGTVMVAADEGLLDAAEFILQESNRTVPIEEGTLGRSGTATVDRRHHQAAVAYDTPYAVRQHEDTRLRHDEGRRAKWLQRTAEEKGDVAVEHVANAIRAGVDRRTGGTSSAPIRGRV